MCLQFFVEHGKKTPPNFKVKIITPPFPSMIFLSLVIWNYCQEPAGEDKQKDEGEALSTVPGAGGEDSAVRQREVESEAKKAMVSLPGCGWGHARPETYWLVNQSNKMLTKVSTYYM